MASWITHLRIAENLLAAWPALDPTQFTFGSLAPDTGTPTGDGFTYDPPKEVTHFLAKGHGEGRIQDLVMYRRQVAPRAPDAPAYSFALGYFCHLVCDNLWALRVVRAIKQDHIVKFDGKGHLLWQSVNPELAAIDWRYMQQHPDGLLQRIFLPSPNPAVPFAFLKQQGVEAAFDEIRHMYRAYTPPPYAPTFDYINETAVSRYVADATAALIAIEQMLWHGDHAEHATAIALLAPEASEPYREPLGDVMP